MRKIFYILIIICVLILTSVSILNIIIINKIKFALGEEINSYDGKWYSGEMHSHTNYSDGENSMEEMAAKAEELGLDWIIITDHLSTPNRQLETVWSNYKSTCKNLSTNDFICIAGEEISEGKRHYLAYNLSEYVGDNQDDPQKVINGVKSKGGIGIIAHPFSRTVNWDNWSVTDYDGIEVWNVKTELKKSIEKWDQVLSEGKKVVGIGGSDAHSIYELGQVKTTCYMENLTEKEIINAIKEGRCFFGNGPSLRFDINGVNVGGTLKAKKGRKIILKMSCDYTVPVSINLIKNGIYVGQIKEDYVSLEDTAEKDSYYRLGCISEDNKMAFSDPIYVSVF